MRRFPVSKLVPIACLAVVLLYAGLLRFDALYKSYGPYERPHWLAGLQPTVASAAASLTPNVRWRHIDVPYVGGDPVNYLKFAREMRSFYAAHVREPGFPGATRVALILTGNEDVAVSLTSITFALLTLVATFALGSAMASPAAGIAAAAALGIDRSAVIWAIGGWRDEMFAFFAVMSAWAWLRLSQHPTDRRGAIAGVVSAGALLTRITSLAFLVPVGVFLIVRDPARRPLRQVGIATAITIALTAPFFINCAIATGDPFYAINNHTEFYLRREGTPEPQPMSAFQYSIDKFRFRPLAAIDTVATGVFLYPFANKWTGLDAWSQGFGQLLASLAIAGLVAWLWQRDGRLLLLMLLSALIPFSVTWTVIGGSEWRLTLFAYAFQLLAAFWMLETLVRHAPRWRSVTQRQIVRPLVTVMAMTAAFTVWTYAMRYAVVRETLKANLMVTIPTGHRDRWFFDEGWSQMVRTGNVGSRFATLPVATARLLLPDARPYTLVMRLHPLNVPGTPQQRVDVAINDQLIGSLELTWNAERIGEYRLAVPASVVRPGFNQLAFRSQQILPIRAGTESFPTLQPDQAVAFRLWYVSIVPS